MISTAIKINNSDIVRVIQNFSDKDKPLTEDQMNALIGILRWFGSDTRMSHCLLKGYAGTGKTTIVQVLCRILQHFLPELRIGQCAYSNKARGTMQQMINKAGLRIQATTCCSMLGRKLVKKHGKITFEKDRYSSGQMTNFDLVIVDEAYSVAEELIDHFEESSEEHNVRLLFVGDYAQLGPIEGLHSPVASLVADQFIFELTKVVRYGGPILDFATRIRGDLRTLHELPTTEMSSDKSTGIHISPDARKILAFTNNRVDTLNALARETIHGKPHAQLPQFVVGERIVFDEPYMKDEQTLFYTSDEVTVLDITPKKQAVRSLSFNALELFVQYKTYDSFGYPKNSHKVVVVVAKESQDAYKRALAKFSKNYMWPAFWELKEFFGNVKYGYAMTTHKAQGSTFADVFVDAANFRQALRHTYDEDPQGHVINYNRLLYTASTRPTDRLFLGV